MPSRTAAILQHVRRNRDEELERGLVRLFGASSIEECLGTYEKLGGAERASLDEAVERIAGGVEVQAQTADRAPSWVELDPELAQLARAGAEPPSRIKAFTVRREAVSIGRSYRVEDATGARAFRVRGRLRFARTFSIEDAQGNTLYSIREKLLTIDPTFVISRDGLEAAVLKRTTTSGAATDRFEIAMQSGEVLRASGKLWTESGVQVVRGGASVAAVRREQNVLRERFSVELAEGADPALLLAIAMSIVETDSNRGAS